VECADRPSLVGTRAVVDPMLRCGLCRSCRAGRYNCCVNLQLLGVHVDGGLREVTAIDVDHLFPVPEELPDHLAVFAEPLAVAYHAVRRSAIEPGGVGVVFGAGTIGLLIAQLLVHARGCRALVIDINAERLGRAAAAGAETLTGSERDVMEAVREVTGGEMAGVVFEATGNPRCTRLSTDLVGHGGHIVLIGWNRGPIEVDTVTLMRKEVDLLGSRNSLNAFPAVLHLLTRGVIDPSPLITHRFPLVETARALALLDGPEEALKILIVAA
jgi:L-gulonate 5-dehydrogenase